MAQYDNNLSGALFKKKHRNSENSPHYTGECEIEGKVYWISAWVKTPRSGGDKFMSLAFTEKDAPQNSAPAPVDDFDDDIPF